MKKYNVALSNAGGIFDEHNGFASIAAALEFATGRGGSYTIQIDAGQAANGKYVCIGYNDDDGIFIHRDAWDDVEIPRDTIAEYISRYV